MKHLKTWLSPILICLLAGLVTAQPRRPRTSGAPPPVMAEVASDDDPLANFADKGLPPPAILGLRPSSGLAKAVAPRILKNDAASLSVLAAALQKAGFHIIDTNQKILYRPTSIPIGAAFYDFEVAGMLRATGVGAVTTVEKLGKLIVNNDSELSGANLSKLLLIDLRTARTSTDPQTQFIAGLIFELGKGTSDLLTATPSEARINLIQASLIERIFLGDLLDAYERFSEQNASLIRGRPMFNRDRGVQFVPALWNLAGPTPCEQIADVTKVVGIEGDIKKVAGKVFDKDSIPSFFTAPKEAIKKRFENVAKGIESANLISSYIKLIMANMNIKADITLQDPMPLVRTLSDREFGERRDITAKFSIDIKNSDTINCVGKAVKAATGLSVEVPEGGPMKNVPVKWEIVLEGSGYSKFGRYPVIAVALDEKKGDINKQVTNELGENKIKLVGKPQLTNLKGQPVVPMAKMARLTVSVATENMNASEDIPKVFSFGLDGSFGLKAFITLAPDIIAKMALKTYKVAMPVRDWQPCSEDWGGQVTYTKKSKTTIVVKASKNSNGNSTGDGVRIIEKDVEVNIVLNPRTPQDIIAKKDPHPADYVVRVRYSDIFNGTREGDPCCGPKEGTYTTKFRIGSETKFFGTFRNPFGLRVTGGDRDYSLSFDFSTDLLQAQVHEFTEILETNCPLEYGEEKSEDSEQPMIVEDNLPEGRYGERFVNTAGELLQGSQPPPGAPNKGDITWKWELARCKS